MTEILEEEDIKLSLSRVHKLTGDKEKSDSYSTIISHQSFQSSTMVRKELRKLRAFSSITISLVYNYSTGCELKRRSFSSYVHPNIVHLSSS